MITFDFKKWNTITGWLTFIVALITYSLTVEPTLSYWDCGEYIATSAKLQVGHPPGAPLFQMVGAIFSMFATDVTNIALMVNMVSVVSSAFTILFMFWSLTMIMQNVVSKFSEITKNNQIAILGGSMIASLAFTFSDTFWYSAVEAEVYAMSSLFISILIWLGLRWEQDMQTPRGNRWLLAISLFLGLSFGVHFMALLTIPSIGLMYYFKHYKEVTIKNFIIANIAIVAVLFLVFKFLLPYTLAFFGKTEIFMVNSLGLPFNSGTIFASLLLISLFIFGLKYTRKKEMVKANTIILCVLFLFIGFSTWLMLPIRSNANVVINENRPSDAAELLAYYNREQYGEQKTFYGSLFSETYAGLDPVKPFLDDKPNYERDYKTGKYVIVNNYKNALQNLDDAHKAFLPRMRSTDQDHPVNYMKYTDVLDFQIDHSYPFERDLASLGIDIDNLSDEELNEAVSMVKAEMQNSINQFKQAYNSGRVDEEDYHSFLKNYGSYLIVEKPTFVNNVKFMFEYQFGYMFWRYLMWNFSGRQNDVQGKGDFQNGNWLSGISFIDEARLGNQDMLSTEMLNNKGRNIYYMLPFILAVIGLVFHAKKDWKSFYVLFVLFLFMGIALKIFLNERPFEPRERDYAVVGAFYAFAFWIGFGVYAIYDFISKKIQPKVALASTLAVTFLAAPILMAKENWDDHDRSNKYTALTSAKSYLDSCEPNAIIFTIGDNDTFPLWYLQEIENYRTDVRVVCTALLVTDWYIDQMKMKAHKSEPLPITFTHDQYSGKKLEFAFYKPLTDERMDVQDFLDFIKLDDERTYITESSGQKYHFFPSNKIRIPVNKENVLKNKIVDPKDADKILPYIDVDIKGSGLYIHRLMMLDIIANNNWERPIYFSGGAWGEEDFVWMKDYLQLDGMVYKLVPYKTKTEEDSGPREIGSVNIDKTYDVMMNLDWGNSGSENIYHDIETRRNALSYRMILARLLEKLLENNDTQRAKNIINLAMEKMPVDKFEFDELLEPFIIGYYELGEKENARKVTNQIITKYQEKLNYFESIDINMQNAALGEIYRTIEAYRNLLLIMRNAEDLETYEKNIPTFNKFNGKFKRLGLDNEPSNLQLEGEEKIKDSLIPGDSLNIDELLNN